MKYRVIIGMAMILVMPCTIKPMEPQELMLRKQEREREYKRYQRERRRKQLEELRETEVIRYWLTVTRAIEKGGLQELRTTANVEGLDISVNRKDPKDNTILHFAAKFNTPDVIERYVVNGVNPDPENNKGLTPLMIAANRGSFNAAQALLQKGARINVGTKRSASYPLFEAVDTNNWGIVRLLLEHGANLDFKDSAQYSVLEYLEELKDTEGLEKLISILRSLEPTEQRTQWINQIADIQRAIVEQEERKLLEGWTIIPEEPESIPDIPLEQRAREAAKEAAQEKKPEASKWRAVMEYFGY